MKRICVHEIIPEKSEEDCEFTISIRDSHNEKNQEQNNNKKVYEKEHEEKTDSDIYEANINNKGKKKLLVNLNRIPEKIEPFSRIINKTYVKEDPFVKNFNSEKGNRSVPVIVQIYDSTNKKVKINLIRKFIF
jgi:hypothetical protein